MGILPIAQRGRLLWRLRPLRCTLSVQEASKPPVMNRLCSLRHQQRTSGPHQSIQHRVFRRPASQSQLRNILSFADHIIPTRLLRGQSGSCGLVMCHLTPYTTNYGDSSDNLGLAAPRARPLQRGDSPRTQMTHFMMASRPFSLFPALIAHL